MSGGGSVLSPTWFNDESNEVGFVEVRARKKKLTKKTLSKRHSPSPLQCLSLC